jgi:hypothetical protein
MTVLNRKTIASGAYALAESDEPIAPLVKEALHVIDDALDDYGYALIRASLFYPFTIVDLVARIISL